MSLSLGRLAFLFSGRRPLGADDGGLEDLDGPGVDALGAMSEKISPGEDTSSSSPVCLCHCRQSVGQDINMHQIMLCDPKYF